MRFRFGDCVLDTERRELERDGEGVRLSPKAYRLLALLVEHRPRALSKEELHEGVWQGVHVSDKSLSNLVSELRAAIGDHSPDERMVRTVHGFGFAFDAPAVVLAGAVPDLEGGSSCWLVWGERAIPLAPGESVLGRDPRAVAGCGDPHLSRRHARITVREDAALLEDMGSRNGTWHNGSRLVAPVQLEDGDEIRVGPLVLRFRSSSVDASTASWESWEAKPRAGGS
jgi:DNA-binding winged helix-turn-helix (wHTH) protein